jgi:hypothetical protein
MIRSLIISALIVFAAALLGWREKEQYSNEKATREKLLKQVVANPSLDFQSPINIERSTADRAKQEKAKKLSIDFFDLSIRAAQDPVAAFGEEFQRLEADLKSSLATLDPAGIKQFIEECKNNPDLNSQTKQDLNRYIREVFIQNDPIEMTRMMVKSPELFGIGDEKTYDPFSYLIYYYSAQEKDLQIVFECLAESPPAFQSKYIGGALQFGTGSPSQRAELLEEMRYFATTTLEQKELVNRKLSELAFGRPDAKGSFIELSDWIASANLSSEELVAATKDMQEKVRVGDTAQWLDWLTKNDMPDEASKQRAYDLATQWTEKDYQAVGDWLISSPNSPEKTAVAGAYAAKTYPYDPENARKWLQTLPQGPDRTKALLTIYQCIPRDSDEAKEFASEYGLRK